VNPVDSATFSFVLQPTGAAAGALPVPLRQAC
jgi:hypothetical protein